MNQDTLLMYSTEHTLTLTTVIYGPPYHENIHDQALQEGGWGLFFLSNPML